MYDSELDFFWCLAESEIYEIREDSYLIPDDILEDDIL